jgi:diguanylate cyclase (GGDEF)-like protein
MSPTATQPQAVPFPPDEPERLAALERAGWHEWLLDVALDGLVELAARLCGTTSAEINVVGDKEVRFCATRGMGTPGDAVSRELTFCTWTILDPDRPMAVPDVTADPRFADNPFALDGIIGSYHGVPLLVDGQPVGTICVHDPAPKTLDADQLESLRVLAVAAQAHMALRRHVRELDALARTDALTGVANRRAGEEALARELARADRHDAPLSVVMLDLDHFKAYNDRFGHGAGDLLLQRAARAWRHELRASDLLARWGGEEFLAVLPDCPLADAAAVAERLRAAVPAPSSCSAGVALRTSGELREVLLARADEALYAAKAEGRDRIAVASSSDQRQTFSFSPQRW